MTLHVEPEQRAVPIRIDRVWLRSPAERSIHDRLSAAVDLPDAERRLLARERLAAVEAALRGVDDRAARVFRRYRLEGVDLRRIAHELGISVSTVEKGLRKAYDTLLALWERLDEE